MVARACGPSYLGGWGRGIAWTREVKVAVSQDHMTLHSTIGDRVRLRLEKRKTHPGQHGETPYLLKIQKIAGHGGTCLWSQLLSRLRQENCLNPGGRGWGEPRLRHCTPGKLRFKKKKDSMFEGKMLCSNQRNSSWRKVATKHLSIKISQEWNDPCWAKFQAKRKSKRVTFCKDWQM